jgi:hypothetical protein
LKAFFQVFSRCVPPSLRVVLYAGVLATTLATALAAGLPGCDTVDLGPETGPPAGCDAPAPFFISDVWPQYFDHYGCGMSDCHDASSGHGFFRLQNVSSIAPPAPTDPLSTWPSAWAANLRAVQTNVSCANPGGSVVLVVPEGRGQPHPPGIIVTDPTAANALFQMWLQ